MNKVILIGTVVVVIAIAAGIGYVTFTGRYQNQQAVAPPQAAPQAPPAAPPAPPAPQAPQAPPEPKVTSVKLSKEDIGAIIALFNDEPLQGGQKSPRFSKWVNDKVFIFVQFDKSDPKEATTLRLLGLGIKGVFCRETQPQSADFRHFHRLSAPQYSAGHGGQPSEMGYWLFSIAVDDFASGQNNIKAGTTTAFPVTAAAECGYPSEANFEAPGAKALVPEDIAKLTAFFSDEPLQGGQKSPRFSKWVNDRVFIFLQFDRTDPKEAKSVRLMGLGIKGEFCKETQPQSADFRHFHRLNAPQYSAGHGGAPNEQGYWLFSMAVTDFASGQNNLKAGATNSFPETAAPQCGAR
jgi:hypothetical protein